MNISATTDWIFLKFEIKPRGPNKNKNPLNEDDFQWKKTSKQAGIELCQAQEKLGLAKPADPKKNETVFHFPKIEAIFFLPRNRCYVPIWILLYS